MYLEFAAVLVGIGSDSWFERLMSSPDSVENISWACTSLSCVTFGESSSMKMVQKIAFVFSGVISISSSRRCRMQMERRTTTHGPTLGTQHHKRAHRHILMLYALTFIVSLREVCTECHSRSLDFPDWSLMVNTFRGRISLTHKKHVLLC